MVLPATDVEVAIPSTPNRIPPKEKGHEPEEKTMNALARIAESALHASPHPALRLSELLELVIGRAGRSVTPAMLRAALEGRPDRFRILEAWTGPWRSREDGDPRGLRGGGAPAFEPDAWVVAVGSPDTPPDAPRTALCLRESVRWLALGLDGRSRMDASRWYAIAMAERAVREVVARRAA